jgi:hypothetical protein
VIVALRDFTTGRPAPVTELAGALADWRRAHERGADGAGRLLRRLVRDGLDPRALRAAALLVVELDRAAHARRREDVA